MRSSRSWMRSSQSSNFSFSIQISRDKSRISIPKKESILKLISLKPASTTTTRKTVSLFPFPFYPLLFHEKRKEKRKASKSEGIRRREAQSGMAKEERKKQVSSVMKRRNYAVVIHFPVPPFSRRNSFVLITVRLPKSLLLHNHGRVNPFVLDNR